MHCAQTRVLGSVPDKPLFGWYGLLSLEDQIKSGTYELYDCACGTGDMLTVAEETLNALAARHGHQIQCLFCGQEINPETYAVCKSDMLLKGNRKPEHRRGRIQLIDAMQWFRPLRKNLGKKNCELSPEDIERITRTFLNFEETPESKIFPNAAFGYWKVTGSGCPHARRAPMWCCCSPRPAES
jgi:type I restriction-modification system DNA methylase subunit